MVGNEVGIRNKVEIPAAAGRRNRIEKELK